MTPQHMVALHTKLEVAETWPLSLNEAPSVRSDGHGPSGFRPRERLASADDHSNRWRLGHKHRWRSARMTEASTFHNRSRRILRRKLDEVGR